MQGLGRCVEVLLVVEHLAIKISYDFVTITLACALCSSLAVPDYFTPCH